MTQKKNDLLPGFQLPPRPLSRRNWLRSALITGSALAFPSHPLLARELPQWPTNTPPPHPPPPPLPHNPPPPPPPPPPHPPPPIHHQRRHALPLHPQGRRLPRRNRAHHLPIFLGFRRSNHRPNQRPQPRPPTRRPQRGQHRRHRLRPHCIVYCRRASVAATRGHPRPRPNHPALRRRKTPPRTRLLLPLPQDGHRRAHLQVRSLHH